MMTPYACSHIVQRFFPEPHPRVSFVDDEGHELWTSPTDYIGDGMVSLTCHLPRIAGVCKCGEAFGYREAAQ